MHIGYDAKRAFNNTSGLGNYSRFVVSALINRYPQHQYTLFTPRINDLFGNFYADNKTGIVVAKPQGLARIFPAAWRSFGMAAEFDNRKIDLYHGLSNELPYRIFSSKPRMVVTIHDLIFLRYPELYRLPDRVIYKRKFNYACRRADHIIAISEQTKADIVKFLSIPEGKITVVYQDCDPDFQRPNPEHELQEIKAAYHLPKNFVLCVGTMEERKNQLTLLKAWHQTLQQHDHDLVFIGRQTPYSILLHQYAQEHALTGRVHFLPYIPGNHLPGIYRQAKLFVYPSVFEGFGIPVLEALNCGVPVITSTGSCFSEAGGPGTWYVNPQSVEELSQAMTRVLSDSVLQTQMAQTGQQHALQFRAGKTIPQVMKIYENLV